ncbi:MAG TPA: molybdopterin cofactor-binding domain-containing protein [Syntrophales bacterium]|nr:molybdopterin cofactor-binding domain-containing protein [Syntrophales bacterium]
MGKEYDYTTEYNERKSEYAVIGKPLIRPDAWEKVTGRGKFAHDFTLPGMLFGKTLNSPHAHARILNIDTSRAERHPGVKAVVTSKDFTDKLQGTLRAGWFPPFLKDQLCMAKEKVRFIGEHVAAVAAIDEATAEEALDLIDVEYEILPAVFTPEEALKEGAPVIHDWAPDNVAVRAEWDLGDFDEKIKQADFVLEDAYDTQYVVHASLEPRSCLANFSPSGELVVWASAQQPFYNKTILSETLGIPEGKIRVIKPFVGGGFGGKADDSTYMFPIAAALSRKVLKPVKITFTREEEFTCATRRVQSHVDMKIAVKKDGTLLGVDSTFLDNGGAYLSYGGITTFLHGGLQGGPYKIPSMRFLGIRAYTNRPTSGGQRGHGAIQCRWPWECMLDTIAEKLDIDPLEIRRKNGLQKGDVTVNSLVIRSSGHVECIDRSTEAIGWDKKWKKLPLNKGVGMGSNFFCSGAGFSFFFDNPPTHSAVTLEAYEDGGIILRSGVACIGQGCETVLAQIAAEELGVNFSDISVIAGDTSSTPVDFGSYSSRVTTFGGNASKSAASQMKEKLLEVAADELEANKNDLTAREGKIFVKGNPEKGITFAKAIKAYFNRHKELLITHGFYTPPMDAKAENDVLSGKVNLSPTWSFGAHAAEVEVDPETGQLKVQNITAAHDCGFAINPMMCEGQLEGSVQMTFGQALLENQVMLKGKVLNPNFLDYRFPTALDTPPIKSILVESMDDAGPFGAKEASEGTNIPTPPAIGNALYYATGVRIKELPITPDKILEALEKKGGKQ